MRKKSIIKEIKSWTFSILSALIIVLLIEIKIFAKVQVQQTSMESTLHNNEQLILDKLSYNFVEAERGDIIVFLENEEKGNVIDEALRNIEDILNSEKHRRLVKRVIGVSGDEIDIKNGYVYLNGYKLEETYTKGETISAEFKLPAIVGENQLFVLGDNRTVSKDSRQLGFIDYKQVEGKIVYRVYPFDQIGKIK